MAEDQDAQRARQAQPQNGAQAQRSQNGSARATPPEARGIVSRFGRVEIDWPRTVGYYGGIALAVGLEIVDPPIGLFIGAIPLVKMLNHPKAPLPARLVSQTIEGAAIPVGGEDEATVRIFPPQSPQEDRQEQAKMSTR
jgi:hypothetical protein